MSKTPLQIEIFTDFVCPWCYLATAVVEQLKARQDVEIKWSPYPLHPAIPPDGMLLSVLLPGVDLDAAHQRLDVLMDELGLEHTRRTQTYNTRLAQELFLWAQTQPNGSALGPLLYRAYFAENRNLAKTDVLLDLVARAGLDVEAAKKVLEERTFKGQLDDTWEYARKCRISGVPTFIASGYQMTGFHPLSDLQRFVEFAQAKADESSSAS